MIRRRDSQAGVSLIEVMIAVLVMGVGMLGFALLQTVNVRFTQSANHRTHATNLAYDMLDQMRVNRILAAQYAGDYGATVGQDCSDPNPDGTVNADSFRATWECRLGAALGADATATVTYDGGDANVAITWGDQRWEEDEDDRNSTFAVGSRL